MIRIRFHLMRWDNGKIMNNKPTDAERAIPCRVEVRRENGGYLAVFIGQREPESNYISVLHTAWHSTADGAVNLGGMNVQTRMDM